MTESLTVSQSPAPMRILDSPIGKVIPVTDIIDYIGYSRSTITRILKVYEEKISPNKTFIPLETSGGDQMCLCLNREGVDYLFLLIHPSKSKMSLDQLLEYRKTIIERLGEEKKDVVIIQERPRIEEMLERAKHYAVLTEGNVKEFQAAIFRKYNLPELADALTIPSVPATVHGETGWYNVSQLCDRFPIQEIEGHPERLNLYLKNQGYQYRDQGLWRLQPKGEVHGKEYWYEAPSGHREIRIRWRLSIMYACGLVKDDPAPISTAQIRSYSGV